MAKKCWAEKLGEMAFLVGRFFVHDFFVDQFEAIKGRLKSEFQRN
jgi:hypothetical protein